MGPHFFSLGNWGTLTFWGPSAGGKIWSAVCLGARLGAYWPTAGDVLRNCRRRGLRSYSDPRATAPLHKGDGKMTTLVTTIKHVSSDSLLNESGTSTAGGVGVNKLGATLPLPGTAAAATYNFKVDDKALPHKTMPEKARTARKEVKKALPARTPPREG